MTILGADTMRCVVFDTGGRIRTESRPVPRLADPRQALIRVRATGICGTDRAILLGEFPATPGVILGHETVGEIVAVGDDVRLVRPGDKVVVNPTFYCGDCPDCRRGRAQYCPHKDGREVGIDCPGTMADYVMAHERFLHRLPMDLPYRRAALIEPLACVLANLEMAAPRWDDQVLVAGAGPIGMLAAMVLADRGHRPRLAERDPVRVRMARQILPNVGVVHTADLDAGRPDVVIDTTGVLMGQAATVVQPGGTVVAMGEREQATATLSARSIATRGIRVVGAGPYPPRLFEVALGLAGDLPLEILVTHELPLALAADAFALLGVGPAAGYQAGKVLLVPDDSEAA